MVQAACETDAATAQAFFDRYGSIPAAVSDFMATGGLLPESLADPALAAGDPHAAASATASTVSNPTRLPPLQHLPRPQRPTSWSKVLRTLFSACGFSGGFRQSSACGTVAGHLTQSLPYPFPSLAKYYYSGLVPRCSTSDVHGTAVSAAGTIVFSNDTC